MAMACSRVSLSSLLLCHTSCMLKTLGAWPSRVSADAVICKQGSSQIVHMGCMAATVWLFLNPGNWFSAGFLHLLSSGHAVLEASYRWWQSLEGLPMNTCFFIALPDCNSC